MDHKLFEQDKNNRAAVNVAILFGKTRFLKFLHLI